MLAFRAHLALFSDKTKRCRETSAVGRGRGAGSGCGPGHRASRAAEIRPPVRAGCLPPHPAGPSAAAGPCRSALAPLPPAATALLPARASRSPRSGARGAAEGSRALPGGARPLAGSRHGGCPRGATGTVLRARNPEGCRPLSCPPGLSPRPRGAAPARPAGPRAQRSPASKVSPAFVRALLSAREARRCPAAIPRAGLGSGALGGPPGPSKWRCEVSAARNAPGTHACPSPGSASAGSNLSTKSC